jgi:phage terminase large subunit-like protein
MKDYVASARAYEAAVLDGMQPACKWVRRAVERNRRDLARIGTPDFPYVFDDRAAGARCFASEQFPHIKGPKAVMVGQDDQGRSLWQTIELEPWQCWLQSTVYGWKHARTGRRRFKVALILVPRKNAKSTLGAINILCALTVDGEGGAEVYSAATTRDQAKVSAEIAWEQARRTPSFREAFGIRIGAKTTRVLEIPDTASRFSPLSADAHSLDGLNVSFALIDELHAHKTRAVWDVLETATGARDQPMLYAITTAGSDVLGICYEKLEYLRKILDGLTSDEEFFGVEYTLDEGDEWDDERVWAKANPNLGVSVSLDDLRRKAREARQSPGARNNFLTKHLNVWVTAQTPCLSVVGWRNGQSPAARHQAWLEELRHESCWVGLDLASKIDLCALSFVFPPTAGRPRWRLIQHLWTPADTLLHRAHRDRAPYGVWVEQGWLKTTPGTRIDQRVVRETLCAARELYDIAAIGFDPWHGDKLIVELVQEDGFAEDQVLEVPQTYAGMSSACLRVQAEILDANMDAGGCPVTAWAVSNVVGQRDGKDNLMFAKGKSRGRIDPVIAPTIAVAMYLKEPLEGPSVYESRGALVL